MFRATASWPLRRLLVLCAVLFAASILHADDFWKNKPRSEWSLKQTLKLLEDSPWARREVRTLIQPGAGPDAVFDRSRTRCDPDGLDAGGNCIRPHVVAPGDSSQSHQVGFSTADDVVFLVRWESSAPIEDAFARLAELGERATAQYLSIPPRLPADRYVVTLKALEKSAYAGVPPGAMPPDPIGQIESDSAGPRARLSSGNLSAAPVESERSGVGAAEAVHFYFPREVDGAPLIPLDRPSRVSFEFRGQRFSLKTHFSLTPDMLR
jgi:hypothetical protein